MSTNQQNNEEEVDLGSLFKIIGKGFSNLFNFIGNIFKGIFHFFITLLLFIKDNIFKFIIAGVVGFVLGFVLDLGKEKLYGSDLIVQPNFESTRQLYKTIEYYNNLISSNDSITLSEIFEIDLNKASSLKSFNITPVKTDDDKIEKYHKVVQFYDTVATINYSFEEFKNSFTDLDYKRHNIHVEATDSKVFSKLQEAILSSIIYNEYFRNLKTLRTENLNRKDSLFRENLFQVDTLRKVYMSSLLADSKKSEQGTRIDLGGQKSSYKELDLFETNRKINQDIESVYRQKILESEIFNVISGFQDTGYPINKLTRNAKVKYTILAIVLTFVFLLLLKLNRYLDNYKK